MTGKVIAIVLICSGVVWMMVVLAKVAIDVQHIRDKVDRAREEIDLLLRRTRDMELLIRPQPIDLANLMGAQRQTEEQQRRVQDFIQRTMVPTPPLDPHYYGEVIRTEHGEPRMWVTYGQSAGRAPDPDPGLLD